MSNVKILFEDTPNSEAAKIEVNGDKLDILFGLTVLLERVAEQNQISFDDFLELLEISYDVYIDSRETINALTNN